MKESYTFKFMNVIFNIQSKKFMSILSKNSITVVDATLLFFIVGMISYEQHHLHFAAEAGEGTCIDYDSTENTIAINCDASFLDLVQTINDPDIIENTGNGEYILNANLEVADGITFEMTSEEDGLQYLKITGANGIIVHGRIEISGI
ncbi:MAG TPA: hypothetical protein VJ799_10075, partial [Nitrososphaeraceae archaeon]|nr:hypothetical protein [Nitrososphaeraceae archaeon]